MKHDRGMRSPWQVLNTLGQVALCIAGGMLWRSSFGWHMAVAGACWGVAVSWSWAEGYGDGQRIASYFHSLIDENWRP